MGEWLGGHTRILVGGGIALVGVMALVAVRGCGGPGESVLAGKVVGKDGRPVTWGTVTVVASDNSVHTAPIRPDGTYEVAGLPPGPTRLAVTSPSPRQVVGQPVAGGSTPAAGQKGGPPSGQGAGMSAGSAGGGGAVSNPGGKSGKKQVIGITPDLPPPQVTPPANLPPQAQWFPVNGRFGNPATSGLSAKTQPGKNTHDITVE